MRGSDLTRRGLMGALLATSGMLGAQAVRPGRGAGFGAGFRFLVADQTIRAAYEVTGIPASGSYPTVVRWQENNRQKLIIRNPADSGGNVILSSKSNASGNNAIDTGQMYTPAYTLAPGQELVDTVGSGIGGVWLARSDQATAPATLYLQVETEIAA